MKFPLSLEGEGQGEGENRAGALLKVQTNFVNSLPEIPYQP